MKIDLQHGFKTKLRALKKEIKILKMKDFKMRSDNFTVLKNGLIKLGFYDIQSTSNNEFKSGQFFHPLGIHINCQCYKTINSKETFFEEGQVVLLYKGEQLESKNSLSSFYTSFFTPQGGVAVKETYDFQRDYNLLFSCLIERLEDKRFFEKPPKGMEVKFAQELYLLKVDRKASGGYSLQMRNPKIQNYINPIKLQDLDNYIEEDFDNQKILGIKMGHNNLMTSREWEIESRRTIADPNREGFLDFLNEKTRMAKVNIDCLSLNDERLIDIFYDLYYQKLNLKDLDNSWLIYKDTRDVGLFSLFCNIRNKKPHHEEIIQQMIDLIPKYFNKEVLKQVFLDREHDSVDLKTPIQCLLMSNKTNLKKGKILESFVDVLTPFDISKSIYITLDNESKGNYSIINFCAQVLADNEKHTQKPYNNKKLIIDKLASLIKEDSNVLLIDNIKGLLGGDERFIGKIKNDIYISYEKQKLEKDLGHLEPLKIINKKNKIL